MPLSRGKAIQVDGFRLGSRKRPGPPGPEGNKGDTGSQGNPGPSGLSITGPTGLPGPVGPTGIAGSIGPAGATGPIGPSGLTVYDSSGAHQAAKIWIGTTTIDASGNFSCNYSSAGFTSIPNVQIAVKSVTNGSVLIPGTITATLTGCSGTSRGLSVLLGLLTLGLSSISGSVLNVQAVGY